MTSYEQFLDDAPRPILIIDRNGKIIFANKAARAQGFLKPIDTSIRFGNPQVYFAPRFPESQILDSPKSAEVDSHNHSIMIHQLKAPLAAIKWVVEDLLSDDLLNEHQLERINDLYKTNEFAISLVNDLLNVTKLESGKIEVNREPTDIVRLIESMIKMLKPAADRKNQKIRFRYGFPKSIDTSIAFGNPKIEKEFPNIDPSLFNKALQNLLDDAVDYAPKDTEITITLSHDVSKEECVISVHNEGSVISAEDQEKIFTKFYRGETAKKLKPSGTGLGLYIAKLAVEANGGRIWFESSAEGGTTFFFSAPA